MGSPMSSLGRIVRRRSGSHRLVLGSIQHPPMVDDLRLTSEPLWSYSVVMDREGERSRYLPCCVRLSLHGPPPKRPTPHYHPFVTPSSAATVARWHESSAASVRAWCTIFFHRLPQVSSHRRLCIAGPVNGFSPRTAMQRWHDGRLLAR